MTKIRNDKEFKKNGCGCFRGGMTELIKPGEAVHNYGQN